MRYLLLSSCLFVFSGCGSSYRQLQRIEGDASCIEKFRPKFTIALYTTRVNIIGNYLTGLLVIKTMADSNMRVVFTSEMGLSLFDFEFRPNGDFKVYHIIDKMNRKTVIKTLRQDFELVLMQRLNTQTAQVFRNNDRIYFGFKQENGSNYYITDPDCRALLGIEKASKRKAIVQVVMNDYTNGIPDTIGISHTNFQFTIGLKRLER